jgi:hypothetical protein
MVSGAYVGGGEWKSVALPDERDCELIFEFSDCRIDEFRNRKSSWIFQFANPAICNFVNLFNLEVARIDASSIHDLAGGDLPLRNGSVAVA